MGRTFRSLAVAWVLSFLTLSGIADAQAQYTLTELPVASFTEVRAFGISANGQIVGGNDALGQAGPLYWSSSTATPTALVPGPGGAAPNEVYGVNSAGQIVDDFVEFPFFWASPTATPTPLSVGAFVQNVGARGINDAGQIVGSRSDGIPLFWVSPASDPTELARGSFAAALAFGIANDGAIAGASSSD